MNNNKDKKGDFFSRSIRATFTMSSGLPEDMVYKPSRDVADENMPAFLRNQVNGKQKRDPAWTDGWHNGFPPGAGA
jgi:hypothetical protein